MLLIVATVVVAVPARLYRKAARETSLIRTGMDGEKIALTGGAIALPYFHEVTKVNMRARCAWR